MSRDIYASKLIYRIELSGMSDYPHIMGQAERELWVPYIPDCEVLEIKENPYYGKG